MENGALYLANGKNGPVGQWGMAWKIAVAAIEMSWVWWNDW